ncbi:MAG: HD domain-containing protein [Brevinematia bacterium]
MNKLEIINVTEDFVKRKLKGDSTGHDWYHIERVRRYAIYIQKKENKGDRFVLEMSALLHDIDDWKLKNDNEKVAIKWMDKIGLDNLLKEKILKIIEEVSFKGALVNSKPSTIEGKILQDADRIDSIGAIGIARAFAFGGKKGQQIYDESIPIKYHKSFEEYKSSETTSINHFYEKLLLLKELMNTKTGHKIAKRKHRFMLKFLKEFYREWNEFKGI